MASYSTVIYSSHLTSYKNLWRHHLTSANKKLLWPKLIAMLFQRHKCGCLEDRVPGMSCVLLSTTIMSPLGPLTPSASGYCVSLQYQGWICPVEQSSNPIRKLLHESLIILPGQRVCSWVRPWWQFAGSLQCNFWCYDRREKASSQVPAWFLYVP